jgi:Type VII secretion system ESX-1, transport TM domain B
MAMTTKRDLAEAYAFDRRRLVTALVSGASGGREEEPRRPARTLVGGVALALLLLAGAPVADKVLHRQPGAAPPADGPIAPTDVTRVAPRRADGRMA